MANNPPAISPPPWQTRFLAGNNEFVNRVWVPFIEGLYGRVGGPNGAPIVGRYTPYESDAAAADLASAGEVVLLDAEAGTKWKCREIILSGAGTNFSGGGGDRDLAITDGTTVWTVIPAATLQALAVGRWGDAVVPWPAIASDLTAQTQRSADIVAKYSGGTTDYAAGSCTLYIVTERMS